MEEKGKEEVRIESCCIANTDTLKGEEGRAQSLYTHYTAAAFLPFPFPVSYDK